MSVWFECRLFDLARFESLKEDFEALIRGEVRPGVRAAALEGLAKLEQSDAFGDGALRDYYAKPLRAIAHGPSNISEYRAVPSVNPLLTTVCMVGYERISYEQGVPAPRNVVQLAERDGNLYAELTTRSAWIHALFNTEPPYWPADLPLPEPPDYRDCQHRALMVLSRAQLARLEDELSRLASDPTWLKELSWDRVVPAWAAPAFQRLRNLVANARRDPHLTIAIEING
jgi:hypothetical protein